MTITYIDLVNRLRDRFNEPRLTTTTWNTAVGFDQFTKDAINYAYHDILNAEMEWPFLHAFGIIKTVPGLHLYNLVNSQFFADSSVLTSAVRYDNGIPYDNFFKYNSTQTVGNGGKISVSQVKSVDWDSFFVYNNENITIVSNEAHVIPSTAPFTIATNNFTTWTTSLSVIFQSNNQMLTPVMGVPLQNQYTITNNSGQSGIYVFNALDAGKTVLISYTTASTNTINPGQKNATDITYIDYDLWRQRFLITDLNALPSAYQQPSMVYKTYQMSQAGFSPVPDVIYQIGFECWIDVDDMVNTTDQPVIPERYWQVIIDGAQKYCYEFREDAALSTAADARLQKGIARMRIELINRESIMNAGFYWYPHGRDYTSNVIGGSGGGVGGGSSSGAQVLEVGPGQVLQVGP